MTWRHIGKDERPPSEDGAGMTAWRSPRRWSWPRYDAAPVAATPSLTIQPRFRSDRLSTDAAPRKLWLCERIPIRVDPCFRCSGQGDGGDMGRAPKTRDDLTAE